MSPTPEQDASNGNGYFKGNIDARVSGLEDNVRLIMTNHLPHIQKAIDDNHAELERKLDGVMVSLTSSLEGTKRAVDNKLDSLKTWVIAALGALVGSLILLVLNLLK